jgi:hypothetical protein
MLFINQKRDIILVLTQSQNLFGAFYCIVALEGRLANEATLRVSVLGQPGRPFGV